MSPLIEISGVSKRYRGATAAALDGVTLAIPEGSVFGLLGPNAAGKTTLLSILLGLVRKDAGHVRVAGCDADAAPDKVRRLCGLAPQELGFYPTLTAGENLQFYGSAGGLSGARLAERVKFAAATAQLREHLGQRADRLSGGLKRRLNLALSLLHEPRALFLDEPTVGVDPQSRAFILDVVRKLRDRGVTIVYTSHYMEEVQQVCDRVAILDRGRVLAQAALAELLSGSRALYMAFARQLPAAAVAALQAAAPGAEVSGAELRLRDEAPLAAFARLQPVLASHGLEPIAVRYGHRDLEELFLQLTHRQLRD
jgi:ABC-2 type transport system ATP-binding protein